MSLKRSIRYATGRALAVWKVAALIAVIWASITQVALLSQRLDIRLPSPDPATFYHSD